MYTRPASPASPRPFDGAVYNEAAAAAAAAAAARSATQMPPVLVFCLLFETEKAPAASAAGQSVCPAHPA